MPAWATPQPVDDADLQAQLAAAETARNTDDDALRALVTLLNGYVDTLEAKLTPPLLVGSVPATISDTTYDPSGNLTAWTQNGIAYEATYDLDGNLLTQGPA